MLVCHSPQTSFAYFMRLTVTIIALLLTNCLLAQQSEKKYHFKPIGWTIVFPNDFSIIDSADNSSRMERGKKAIEEANDIKTDVSGTITLISATKNTYNYFNSTITSFDSLIDGNYDAGLKELKNMTYKTMSDKLSNVIIDSVTTTKTIDGLIFDKFSLLISIPGKSSFNMVLLTKLYKGYTFGISYVYLDDETRDQIENMLKNSKFDK